MKPKCEKCREYKKQIKNYDRYILHLENTLRSLRGKIGRLEKVVCYKKGCYGRRLEELRNESKTR